MSKPAVEPCTENYLLHTTLNFELEHELQFPIEACTKPQQMTTTWLAVWTLHGWSEHRPAVASPLQKTLYSMWFLFVQKKTKAPVVQSWWLISPSPSCRTHAEMLSIDGQERYGVSGGPPVSMHFTLSHFCLPLSLSHGWLRPDDSDRRVKMADRFQP